MLTLTEKEYRKHPAISRSQLFRLQDSPEKFKYFEENPEPLTPSLTFGQLLHAMVLQPETVAEQFAVAPNVDRRTKGGKKMWAEFEASAQGKTIVTADMAEQAIAMRNKLFGNELVKKLLNGEKEKPFFWTDELTGEECKCRADIIYQTILTDPQTGERYPAVEVVDLKTTDNAKTDTFSHSIDKYGYDFQAGMYLEGIKKNMPKTSIVDGVEKPVVFSFVFVAIEKKPPYSINVMYAENNVLTRGFDLFREYIGTYHYCKTTNNWYGYMGKHGEINSLSLPAWLAKEVE